MTVFQGNAFAQGLVFRHAPVPPPAPPNKATIPKFRVRDYKIRIGGKEVGRHRVMALARGSVLLERVILDRAAAELAEFHGVRRRAVTVTPARGSASLRRPGIDRLLF